MPDIWMDVDTALAEVPVNLMPLVDDTDFKSIEGAVAYNASGLALRWHFVKTDGSYTVTSVTPTTGGAYDWTDQGDSGIYTIEIPATDPGSGTIWNDTEGFGWFTGVATGILPWRGPVIGFRRKALNDLLVNGSTASTNLEDFFDGTGYAGGTAKLGVDVVAVSGDSAAADNAEAYFDGTGYAGTNNVIPTVTTLTNLPAATTDWLTAAAVKADAVTKIQTGLATPTNITAGTITTTTNLTNLPSIPANWITANGIATDAIGADEIAAGAVTKIQSGLATAAALGTVDDFLDTEVAAILAAVDTEVAAIKAKTDSLTFTVAGKVDSNVLLVNGDAVTASTAATVADAVLDEAMADHTAAGSLGKAVADTLAAVDTEVGAIKVVTDKLGTAVELDGAVYRFTANALEQGPAGEGGTADWTADERTALRAILGIPASGTTPADPTSGILDTIRDAIPAAAPSAATVASQVRTELGTELARIDVATSTRLASASYTAQTGDAYARLGAPAGASIAADIAAVKVDTAATLADTGTDGVVVAAASKTGYALTTTPPTAVQIRQEIDSNSTQLAAIVDDTGTAGVVVAAASKTGYALASTGLDAIAVTAPSGVATTFPGMVVQLWRRFFKRAVKDATAATITTFADNGTTVVTTQAITDDGAGNEVQGAAS
jgi:hypothetical protein